MESRTELRGHTYLVTGASRGLGEAIALGLSRRGASVVLVARDEGKLAEVRERLGAGGSHHVEPFDLEKPAEIPAWLKKVAGRTGPLSGVVHAAGVQITKPLRFVGEQDVATTFNVNTNAALYLAKGYRQRDVVATEGGSLVFLSSVMALVGQPAQSVYCASKGALVAMVRALGLELAKEGIRVNAVAPGVVKTEMTERLKSTLTEEQFRNVEAMHPLGLGSPEDVADAVAFLAGPRSRWITGICLPVDGGYTAH